MNNWETWSDRESLLRNEAQESLNRTSKMVKDAEYLTMDSIRTGGAILTELDRQDEVLDKSLSRTTQINNHISTSNNILSKMFKTALQHKYLSIIIVILLIAIIGAMTFLILSKT